MSLLDRFASRLFLGDNVTGRCESDLTRRSIEKDLFFRVARLEIVRILNVTPSLKRSRLPREWNNRLIVIRSFLRVSEPRDVVVPIISRTNLVPGIVVLYIRKTGLCAEERTGPVLPSRMSSM